MANQEQLSILKQGVDVWNEWREENPDAEVDLSKADLNGEILSKVEFALADLDGSDVGGMRGPNLRNADLSGANLSMAFLNRANLNDVNLLQANLDGALLDSADLTGAILMAANLSNASLRNADLTRSDLRLAKLSHAHLSKTNLLETTVGSTTFGYLHLCETVGLEDIIHDGPSSVGIDTIKEAKGKLSPTFLRGCGLSDWEVESAKLYNPDLSNDAIDEILYRMHDLRATQALQISPLFISYSHGDMAFVDKLERYLDKKGVRFWRDVHDMKAGRLETQIESAIRQNPTVLLILSEHSLKSDWVEHEVKLARTQEKELRRDVICPVTLDGNWKDGNWPKRVMEQVMEYNILDFSIWKDDSKFENAFNKLINGLELFYK